MNNNLFQNDSITGNSIIGFEFRGTFEEKTDTMIDRLKEVLNRNVTYSNINYKLLEPTDKNAALIEDGNYTIIKTPMYSYFEAIYILPKLLEFLKGLKEYKNSYLYFKLGFNEEFVDLNQINITKFVLTYNEEYILKSLGEAVRKGDLERLSSIKPVSYETCKDPVQKHINSFRFLDDVDNVYGIDFTDLKFGYITFKYAQGINYRNKWEDLLKSINHTLITLYNTSKYTEFGDDDIKKLEKMNNQFIDISKSFGCYELFRERYKQIKLTIDLDTDKSRIDVLFTSLRDQLFNIVVTNDIKNAKINYDTDVSRLQLKDVELKGCYHLTGVDIVESDVKDSYIKDCDFYDTKIEDSTISKCHLYGYATCKESKFKDCYVSQNIEMKDCHISGQLGKFGGSLDGGSLKDTIVIVSMAEIKGNVEKNNVYEIC